MTPQEIKKTWEEASRRYYRPTPEEFESMYKERKETALERLATRYRRFSTLGMVMVICSVGWAFGPIDFVFPNARIFLSLLMMVYFATCSSIDYWFYKGVSSIDCYRMSVSEVIDKALYYKKKHLQSILFLLPFAFIVIGAMAYCLSSDKYILLGMAAGAIFGLLIGYRQYREFMSEYRIISEK